MRGLNGTGVQSAAETYTGEMGQPRLCQIRLESRAQQRFRVFIAWAPKQHSTYGYAWLEAVSVGGLVDPSSLHTGTAATPKGAQIHVGDARVPPSEPCRIRIDGAILPVEAR